jgi:NitT/TauT family transport system ATP-binding protein
VSKRYGDGPLVLEAIDLAVQPGEFVGLIGPSGCGKSTLLRLISALSPVTGGELTVDGTTPALAREHQAFIFQEATLLPWLTARRNIELPLRLRGLPDEERSRRAEQALSRVRLEHAAALYPRQMSGGMKMRVSIARALALAPRLLLLDEPFGSLDEMTRNHLNEELLELREMSGFTALFVTHSVAEAVFLSNRVLVMASHPGRLSAEVRVDMPFPRTAAVRESDEFHHTVDRVSRLLHAVEGSIPL